MQVFLPFSDYRKSIFVLDFQRLAKQRVECKEIIDILEGKVSRWRFHPVIKMYESNLDWLKMYYNQTLQEFDRRGGISVKLRPLCHGPALDPEWLGYEPFHLSHQSNLLRKALDDSNGIGASGRKKIPSQELLTRLSWFGIIPSNISEKLEYVWP